MLTRNNTMKYVSYWCEDNYTYLDNPLSSQRISDYLLVLHMKND